MKIGVCRGLDDFEGMKTASSVGVDYWETGFGSLAKFSDDEIARSEEMLESLSLKCRASNGFIPGEMKLVGDSIDYGALSEYINRGFERAKRLGVEKVVFGSGNARSFEDGYSLEKAKEQLAFFLSEYAGPTAKKAGCIIVMEPLRFCESTMIHTVKDGVEIAEMSGCDNVFGLADLYHVYGNGDSISGIADFKGKVKHSHLAEPVNRRYPSANDSDETKEMYKSFFKALKEAGCETCSIEARTDNFAADIGEAVEFLKSLS